MVELENLIDKPGSVREEDSINIAMMDQYVKSQIITLKGDLSIKQFKGGASNLTYELDFEGSKFILRTPPKGTKAKSAHDMHREFTIMKNLKPHYSYVPTMIAFCDNKELIGNEFYIMEKVQGIIPRANLPKGLQLDKDEIRTLCLSVIDKLVELHKIDVVSSNLMQFGKGTGYCKRQIEGWTDRYKKAKTWNVPSFKYVMKWLAENIPTEERSCFIHNDFRFDNVVLDPQNPQHIIGILDWEMATVGDPLMDLGNTLAYWVQADDHFFYKMFRRQPTHLPGMLTRKEIIEYYSEKTGFKSDNFTFYEVYGLFRLAVIIQQIYYRYHHNQTKNKAFKNFWLASNYLNMRCKKMIKESKKINK